MTTTDKQIDDKTVLDFIRPYAKIQNLHSYHLRNLVRDVLRHCRDELTAAREADAKELDELRNKLHFLASKGISVGTLRESGKPPRLSYAIESGSELCDMPTLSKLCDAEIEAVRLQHQLAKLTASDWVEAAAKEINAPLANRFRMVGVSAAMAEASIAAIITRHRDAAK